MFLRLENEANVKTYYNLFPHYRSHPVFTSLTSSIVCFFDNWKMFIIVESIFTKKFWTHFLKVDKDSNISIFLYYNKFVHRYHKLVSIYQIHHISFCLNIFWIQDIGCRYIWQLRWMPNWPWRLQRYSG